MHLAAFVHVDPEPNIVVVPVDRSGRGAAVRRYDFRSDLQHPVPRSAVREAFVRVDIDVHGIRAATDQPRRNRWRRRKRRWDPLRRIRPSMGPPDPIEFLTRVRRVATALKFKRVNAFALDLPGSIKRRPRESQAAASASAPRRSASSSPGRPRRRCENLRGCWCESAVFSTPLGSRGRLPRRRSQGRCRPPRTRVPLTTLARCALRSLILARACRCRGCRSLSTR